MNLAEVAKVMGLRNSTHDGWAVCKSDSVKFMTKLLERTGGGVFDMIFADPPYFLSNDGISCQAGRQVSVNKGDWDKLTNLKGGGKTKAEQYYALHEFNLEWLGLCQDLLKPNGTIWVSGTHHVIPSVGFGMQCLGMKILNSVTWEKPNPPPNLSCRFLTHSTETILWAAKNHKSRHYYNYQFLRQENKNKQLKDVWRFRAPSAKEKSHGKHPTQKPVQLLDRILMASTEEGALVFDPFSGSSTTGVVAVTLRRQFIGCETNDEYVELSRKRLRKAVKDQEGMLIKGMTS